MKISLMLFPRESFPFCAPRKVPTHLSFHRLFLCIFSLIPLLIQALISQRLSAASTVGINLAEHNFRARLLLRLLLRFFFFLFPLSALNSFSLRNRVFKARTVRKERTWVFVFTSITFINNRAAATLLR